MRIDVPHHSERFGAVRIHGVQEVWELDSGMDRSEVQRAVDWHTVLRIPYDVINAVQHRMAIVIPAKSERLKVLDGVLSGVPHDCLIIMVSNSPREPIDRFRMEVDTVERFARLVQRKAVVIHQRDPGLGEAFRVAGFQHLLDDEGLVRDGKGEGMLVGLALAAAASAESVGFIDADNYVPGAVHEYVKAYAAGFHMANTPYAMVRISWRSKPKIQDGRLFFNRWGRSSQVTNRFINLLLSDYSGFGTEVVTTGNAGEHAITVDLAMKMRFGAGFAVEPFQYVDLFESFGGVEPSPHPEVMRQGVEVFQIETRNPHFHENKGADHVQDMRLQALNVLYHSHICPDTVREEIREFLAAEGFAGEPPTESWYPPLESMDLDSFLVVLGEQASTFLQTAVTTPTTILEEPPIPIPEVGAAGVLPIESGGDAPTAEVVE